MSEIAVRYVTVMPKIATGFATQINNAVSQSAKVAGASAGKAAEESVKKHGSKASEALTKTFATSADKIKANFKTLALPLTFAAVTVGAFVKKSVDSFSELEDATGAAGVIFGDSMDKIIAKGETAAATLGMSKAQIIDAANTFGTLGKSANLTGDDLADFSNEMTDVAGSLSSFKGGSPEEAILAVGAALRGESEPIRRYGILLDDATLRQRALTLGITDNIKTALTPQQRVLATQAEILAQSGDAMGDFERTADSTANVQKTLAAESANLSAEIGEKLAPAIVSAQKAGIGFLRWTNENQDLLVPLVATIGTLTAAVAGFVAVAKGIEALKSARETISGLSAATKTASISVGAVGIALTAAALVYGHFAQRNAEAKARVEGFTEAIKADTGAIGENSRAYAANELQKSGALDAAERLGISAETAVSAALNEADAVAAVNAAYERHKQRIEAARDARVDAADSLAEERNAFYDSKAAMTEVGNDYRMLTDVSGKLSSALAESVAKEEQLGRAVGDAERSQSNQIATTATAKMTFEDYTKAINGSYNAQLKLAGSERAAEAAIDEGAERIKEWTAELTNKYEADIKAEAAAKGRKISDEEAGKQAEKRARKEVDAAIAAGEALDINTDAGRRNEEALHAIADTTLAAMAGMTDLEKANGTATERAQRGRDEFMKLAEELGVSADEAQALADKLGLIKPETIDWKINLKFAGPSRVKIGDKYINVGVAGYADGGPIRGGVPGRDSVPALLMPGEHVLTAEEVRRMGGHEGVFRMRAAAGKGLMRFASGGPVMPSYKGHSLDWWEDYLLSDLEYTRLQIRIKDLQADLKERETYKAKGKKHTRDKLRGLERTEAQLELADAQERLRLATEAQQANRSAAGSISDQIGRYQSDLATWESRVEAGRAVYDNAAAIWQQAAQSLGKSAGLGSLDPESVKRSNAVGDVWWEKRDLTAADLARRVSENATQVETFIGLLDELRRAGASEALISDVMALGTVEGTKAARMYLADRSSMAIAESGYARLASSQQRLSAIGSEVGAINVTVNEAATPEATKQAVLAAILAART